MEVTGKYLIKHGFVMMGKNDGYEFNVHQYGGYSDFVFFNCEEKRLYIQYKLNHVELCDCDMKMANKALALVGLPSIGKLQKE